MTEQDRAARLFEEWGVGKDAADRIVAEVVWWWREAAEGTSEPMAMILNTRGDPLRVGAASFLERFGVNMDRLIADVDLG